MLELKGRKSREMKVGIWAAMRRKATDSMRRRGEIGRLTAIFRIPWDLDVSICGEKLIEAGGDGYSEGQSCDVSNFICIAF